MNTYLNLNEKAYLESKAELLKIGNLIQEKSDRLRKAVERCHGAEIYKVVYPQDIPGLKIELNLELDRLPAENLEGLFEEIKQFVLDYHILRSDQKEYERAVLSTDTRKSIMLDVVNRGDQKTE